MTPSDLKHLASSWSNTSRDDLEQAGVIRPKQVGGSDWKRFNDDPMTFILKLPTDKLEALAEAQVSALRVERLLRAHDDALFDLVRPLAHQLASKGTKFDQAALVDLVLSDGAPYEDDVRRSIARDFYRAESANNV